LTDRSYDVVLTPKDIARTRSPRIIKLHGSLPSHTPFIFAEEDYRTYPVKFAPFVNLAQHVLLENELLLLGFSGDDPNFLAWAGWVRDQLGASARRIHLAGVLNLSAARRRYLENLNVSPIDMAPLVAGISDPADRHAKATELLLESLHGAKPKPIHVWTRAKRISGEDWKAMPATARLAQLVKDWEADRLGSPAWLIAPWVERYRLRMDTMDIGHSAVGDLANVEPRLRDRFAAELAWRIEASHLGVPDWAKQPLEDVLADLTATLSTAERVRIRVQLAYNAIEIRDAPTFDRHIEGLEAAREHDREAAPWAAYLRGLHGRDSLNMAAISAAVPNIRGDDPVWLLRRAALLCELRDPKGAARLVRSALLDIRRRRALDRRSLWLVSRESWARFMWRTLSSELRKEEEGDLELADEWPPNYSNMRIEPWDELNALESELRAEQDRADKYSGGEKAHFEAGSWTPAGKGGRHWVAPWVIPVEWLTRRLADTVGVPANAGSYDILSGRLARAVASSGEHNDSACIWRVASYLDSEDGDLINAWFGRIEVAALPQSVVDELSAALQGSIEFWGVTLGSQHGAYSEHVSRLRVFLQLLSRLSVRANPDIAGKLFNLAIRTFEQGGAKHWWIYKSTANLIARSLSAIPPAQRGAHVGEMLTFPLPKEAKVTGISRDWPEFSESFHARDVTLSRPPGDWEGRIAELTNLVAKDNGNQRHRAIQRLWLLVDKNVLTKAELSRFADALWSQRTTPAGLPFDEDFFPGIFLQLPEPNAGDAKAAFDFEIVQPLLVGSCGPGSLESIAYVGSEADKGRGTRPFSDVVALALIKAIGKPARTDDTQAAASAIAFGLLPVATLDEEASDKLWSWATADDGGRGMMFLPYLVRRNPERGQEATTRLTRALNARDFARVNVALETVRRWAHLVERDSFPDIIGAAIASLIAIRREPALFRALDVCVDLVERKMLDVKDLERVRDGLTELFVETDYHNWRRSDFRTATLTYVRANAFRLARALKRSGNVGAVIDDWVAAGGSDPIPEVRYVAVCHS